SRAGSHQEPFTRVDCEAVLHRTLQNLRLALEESQATITYERLPLVQASESQVAVVFQNLLSNALKFRTAAPPRIHLSAQRRGAVGDSGAGQWHWDQARARRTDFCDLPTAAYPQGVSGDRAGAGDQQEDHRAAWRADLGGIRAGQGSHFFLH